MSDLPPPLTPMECDLQGYEWMALFGHKMFGSAWYRAARKDGRGGIAAIKLWWEAMRQVPAGSLPNDEEELCMLADFGEDMRAWRRHRLVAMHGFILCSDNRWYHRFLSEQAAKAWDCRQRAKDSRAAATERMRRHRENGIHPPEKPNGKDPPNRNDVTRHETRTDAVTNTVTEPDVTRHETRTSRLDQETQVYPVQEERKEVLKIPYFGEEMRARGEERDEMPLADEPETFARKPDEPLPEKFQVHVRRASRAMAMSIPYAEVRSVEAQLEALRTQPAAVGADETMGLRWQPADPVRSIQEQAAAMLAGCSPEQIAKAQRYAARATP